MIFNHHVWPPEKMTRDVPLSIHTRWKGGELTKERCTCQCLSHLPTCRSLIRLKLVITLASRSRANPWRLGGPQPRIGLLRIRWGRTGAIWEQLARRVGIARLSVTPANRARGYSGVPAKVPHVQFHCDYHGVREDKLHSKIGIPENLADFAWCYVDVQHSTCLGL